jgi:hypothetical protein
VSKHYCKGAGEEERAQAAGGGSSSCSGAAGAAAREAETGEEMQAKIESFLCGAAKPAALEYGDDLLPMTRGEWSTEIQSGRLLFHVLTRERSLSRRILAVDRPQRGALACIVERFGGKKQKLSLLDLNQPQAGPRTLRGQRANFGERFRRMLQRQFPGWELTILSAEMDLSRSLSPVFPRAIIERNGRQMAAMGCPTGEEEAAMLAFALVWHDLVRRRAGTSRDLPQAVPLHLFLPEHAGVLTAQRLRWLRGGPGLECRLFRYNEDGAAGEVDPGDLGNLETEVAQPKTGGELSEMDRELLAGLEARWQVRAVPKADGALSLRIHGLEFARWEAGKFFTSAALSPRGSLLPERPLTREEVSALAGGLARRRAAEARNRRDPLYRRGPEAWLDSAVRANLECVDARLIPERVYGEVLTRSGIAVGRADLLAITRAGELEVLELKASEDIHLPLQALDYWARIAWHAERGELDHLFPGVAVSREKPRLLLIAPAISFHTTTGTLLGYFSPEVQVERIGINLDWQQGLKVVMRLSGASAPQSHGG